MFVYPRVPELNPLPKEILSAKENRMQMHLIYYFLVSFKDLYESLAVCLLTVIKNVTNDEN